MSTVRLVFVKGVLWDYEIRIRGQSTKSGETVDSDSELQGSVPTEKGGVEVDQSGDGVGDGKEGVGRETNIN